MCLLNGNKFGWGYSSVNLPKSNTEQDRAALLPYVLMLWPPLTRLAEIALSLMNTYEEHVEISTAFQARGHLVMVAKLWLDDCCSGQG